MTNLSRLLAVTTALAAASATVLLGRPALADEVDDLAAKVVALDSKARELDDALRPSPGPGADYPERRALDGEVLYRLKQYEEAAIILLDVVEKYPQSSAYPGALFILADALYQKQDFLSAKRYFAKIVARGAGDRNYQMAVQRLIELALRTGDFTGVEEQLKMLEQVPAGTLLQSVPYVRGKYEFFRGHYDEAQRQLEQIPPTSEYYFQAQYIIGTALVVRKQHDAAATRFLQLLRAAARNDGDKKIQELSTLALGRVYYETGKIDKAIDQYQNVARTSDLFPDALHETAWAFIKQGDFRKAQRSIDLLLLARPDAPTASEMKLLMGNLHLRLGEVADALDIFDKTKKTFEPVQQKLDLLIASRPDAKSFFHALMTTKAQQFEVQVSLPDPAGKWLKQESSVDQAVRVGNDLAAMRESITEAEELVARVERTINSPAKVSVFPELSKARERALEVENQLADARARLADQQRRLTEHLYSAQERAEAERLAGRRTLLEKAIQSMPKGVDGYEKRAQRTRGVYEELEKRAKELWVQIESLAAQLAAIERYYADTKDKQKIPPMVFEQQVGEMRGLVEELRKEYDRLRSEILTAKETLGVGDAVSVEEGKLRAELKQVVDLEKALAAHVMVRLPPAQRAKVEQIQSVLERVASVEERVAAFNQRVDQAVEQRLAETRTILAEEKVKVSGYKQQVTEYEHQSDALGGTAALLALRGVRNRAYTLVVESDVGVTDVAWALKDSKSQSVSRLQREQERERRLLEEEFQQVRQSQSK
jgi:tetratricopeptide (TPR) repeat protein